MRAGAVGLGAGPVANRAGGGGVVARLPEGDRQLAQDDGVVGLGIARVDQPLRGERGSPSASACLAAVMKRSTRSAPGSGFEKSTKWSVPAGTVRIPIGNSTRAHCWVSSSSSEK